ncbi:MAG TPA: ankyrin repeat domain-containing protein [Terracidiphilus sp.]|nr:ankyrin repeat domain-containing protein [Terracidiphilus sp.]HTA79646.1 ankyrin repeat domain-containing protein [Terracidiphilus sp.]
MNQNFLKLIQSGATAEVADAIENDPGLAVWRDSQDVSALMWSVYTGQTMVRDFLVAKLAAWKLPLDVFEAAATGNEARLQAILSESSESALVYSGDGWTALHLAAAFGTPLSVAALIFRGANVHAVSKNAQKNQPLHAAVALGRNTSAIELLLAHGADVNATQAGGYTAIFSAATANRKDLAELLLNHGANPQIASDDGKTPAEFARERGHADLAAWLEGIPA